MRPGPGLGASGRGWGLRLPRGCGCRLGSGVEGARCYFPCLSAERWVLTLRRSWFDRCLDVEIAGRPTPPLG